MSMVLYLRAVQPKEPEVYRAEIGDISQFMFSDDEPDQIVDFDVEWMAMNYVVSRADGLEKLSRLVLFGEGAAPVSEDAGYGPAFYVGPTNIALFADGLSKYPNDELRRHFDPDDMVENYIGYYFTGDAEEDWRGLSRRIDDLRKFLGGCRDNQHAVIGMVS